MGYTIIAPNDGISYSTSIGGCSQHSEMSIMKYGRVNITSINCMRGPNFSWINIVTTWRHLRMIKMKRILQMQIYRKFRIKTQGLEYAKCHHRQGGILSHRCIGNVGSSLYKMEMK